MNLPTQVPSPLNLLLALLLLTTIPTPSLVHAHLIPPPPQSPLDPPPPVPAHQISTYTTPHFIAHALHRPAPATCLFYTAHLTAAAQRHARSQRPPLTTIWSIWPCSYYSNTSAPHNPLRTIMSDPATRQTYFENMSRAFAQLCDRSALLLTRDPASVPADGIWARIEEPALKTLGNCGGRVDEIEACGGRCEGRRSYWRRVGGGLGGLLLRRRTERKGGVGAVRVERGMAAAGGSRGRIGSVSGFGDGEGESCATPEQLQEMFGDVGW